MWIKKANNFQIANVRVILKVTSANLCKTIHDIINYSTSICPFEFDSVKRKEKNYKKLNISRTKINNMFFIVFEGLSIDEKNKNLMKNSGNKL